MIRSLKTLGLALAAVLALSAMAASSASAAPKLTPVPEEYPVTLEGTQVGNHVFELPGGRKFECTTATFKTQPVTKAEAEESMVTADPTYSGCTATILGTVDTVTVTMHSCHFTLTATETTTGTIKTEGWEVTGELHIVCTVPGDSIELHVYKNAEKHEKDESLCTYTIPPQTPAGSLDYRLTEKNAEGNGTSGDINATITGVSVTKKTGTETNCGEEKQVGTYKGLSKVEGFNSKGEMLRGKFED